jgi:hypothetical protein
MAKKGGLHPQMVAGLLGANAWQEGVGIDHGDKLSRLVCCFCCSCFKQEHKLLESPHVCSQLNWLAHLHHHIVIRQPLLGIPDDHISSTKGSGLLEAPPEALAGDT